MHCELLVPDFLPTGEEIQRLVSAELLLARGRRKRLPAKSPEAWLFERFAISRQRDWPVAPYTLLADGGTPEGHFWMRADPVHLGLTRNSLTLAESSGLEISREEAEALVETLNGHFAPAVLFYPMQPERWYVRLQAPPEVQTTPPNAAYEGLIEDHLPTGPDAMRCHALMNEVQMLLHEHPVNAAREARGAPALNSVWLWGGGILAAATKPSLTAVVGNDPLARGLALAAELPARTLPGNAQALLASAEPRGVMLVVLDGPSGDSRGRMHEQRESLERDWLAPLLAALRSGRIGMLTLTLAGADFLLQSETARLDLRRFWRLRKPLARYAA
jgi:hypothetical protein